MERPFLVWVRNDLRFHDNPAIYEASSHGGPVVLLYIFDSDGPAQGEASRVWLERSLESFGERARQRGFCWIVREGPSSEVLKEVLRETLATRLYWNSRYEPEAAAKDREIRTELASMDILVETFRGNLLMEPWLLLNKKGKPFQVFTPYWSAFEEARPDTAEAPEPQCVRPCCLRLPTLTPRELPLCPKGLQWPQRVLSEWQPGELSALEMMETFCREKLQHYAIKRDFPAAEVTSRLSPYLHFGEISPRRVWNSVLDHTRRHTDHQSIAQADAYLRQLGWREFAHAVLYHFPFIVNEPFREDFGKITWRHHDGELRAWQTGHTGIPIVDAGMRQLWQTGWMHNRVRLIVGSFLVKHLFHSWKEGMSWFFNTLVDADLASNTFGWQWISGCGIDPAPFFRIFNPVVQGQRFDPEGAYVRQYVPELCLVPEEYIHKPWEASKEDLLSWNVELSTLYPTPIVNLAEGRERALKAFMRP